MDENVNQKNVYYEFRNSIGEIVNQSNIFIEDGYGKLVYTFAMDNLVIGNNTFKVVYNANGKDRMSSVQTTVTFQIKSKTVPDGCSEFSTLQNFINRAGNELILERNFMYSTVNDADYKDGVVISKDNFVIDGAGHTIDGMGLARIFDVVGKNITIKNIDFVNANSSSNGSAISFLDGGLVEKCNFTNSNAYAAVVYFNGKGTVQCSVFINNSATHYGGAIYFNLGGEVENCDFINNYALQLGGAIFTTSDGMLIVNNSNFTGNYAPAGSAIYGDVEMHINNSVFLKNKAETDNMKLYYDNNEIVIHLIGKNYYINAICSSEMPYFDNVTYWNGYVVNSNDEYPQHYSLQGSNITFDIYNYTGGLIYTVVKVTDDEGYARFNPGELPDGILYKIVATHYEDDYYNDFHTLDVFNIIRDRGSSVNITMDDKENLTYSDISTIGFVIDNRTEVRVIITDPNGKVIFNKTFDDGSTVDSISLSDCELIFCNGYYKIDVCNIGNMEISSSRDSKLFRLLEANSTVENSTS